MLKDIEKIRTEYIPFDVLMGGARARRGKKKQIRALDAEQSDAELLKDDKNKEKQGVSKKELKIREEEIKKHKINEYFQRRLGDNILPDQIKYSSWMTRQMRAPPENIESLQDLIVVEDDWERYPSYSRILYCSLDYSLLILYICFFILFQEVLGFNSNLSVFCIYLFERLLRWIRAEIGEDNLSAKAFIDKNFFN